jgi:ferritin-like metal-binding protein YciE
VHAFESQSVQLLKKSQGIGGNQTLKEIYKHHLDQTEKHALLVEQQLEALDTSPSIVKDSALALGGLSWGFFFQCQSDTPAKLAAFVFAVLHLEIGGYELLKHTAHRCGDQVLTLLCDKIIGEKLAMATSLSHAFPSAVQATLDLLHRQ